MNEHLYDEDHTCVSDSPALMTKYQEFAVMYFLSDFDRLLQYDDILAALAGEDTDYVTVGEAHQHLSMEEVAEDIHQLACDLERWFA